MSLEDKTVIVTGGAQGIGAAIVRRFLKERAKVVIADVDEETGSRIESELQSEGVVHFVQCDVSERLDVHNLIAATLDRFGDVDVLINNAGVTHSAGLLDLTEDDFDRVMGINLKGAFLCSQAVARHMVERVEEGANPGAIVNMSSINATVALPDQLAYCVSKGGLAQLTRVSAVSLAPYGIRVNAIGPGSVETAMLQSVMANPDAAGNILKRTPLGRVAQPSEIAAIAVFLASNEASYITGETIYADGGRLSLNMLVKNPGD